LILDGIKKETQEIEIQTDPPERRDFCAEYLDYTKQKHESARRMARVIDTNILNHHQIKLRDLVETAFSNIKKRQTAVLKAKTDYLEARRELTEEVKAATRLNEVQTCLLQFDDIIQEKLLLTTCLFFDAVYACKIKHDRKVRSLKKSMSIFNSKLAMILWDFIEIVREKTIPLEVGQIIRGSITLSDLAKRKGNSWKCQFVDALRIYLSSLPQKKSPDAAQNRRGKFAAKSRLTGSFMMTMAANFCEGSEKILDLLEKKMKEAFTYCWL